MIAITVAVQYAFMLPVATPPNAVAFTTGKIKVMDMVGQGHCNVIEESYFLSFARAGHLQI